MPGDSGKSIVPSFRQTGFFLQRGTPKSDRALRDIDAEVEVLFARLSCFILLDKTPKSLYLPARYIDRWKVDDASKNSRRS